LRAPDATEFCDPLPGDADYDDDVTPFLYVDCTSTLRKISAILLEAASSRLSLPSYTEKNFKAFP
jgi:hypothetical protein